MIERHRVRRVEVRAAVKRGRHYVTLRPIAPDVVDDLGTLWMPHCFDRSLTDRLPALVWAHDWSEPVGRGVEHTTSDQGPTIRFEFSDFEHVPQAARAYSQVLDGTIVDCSVGFFVPEGGRRAPTAAEKARYPGVREVIERARLDEVSLVLRGAVPGAKVLSVRSGRRTVPYTPETARLHDDRAQGKISELEYRSGLAEIGRELSRDADIDDRLHLLDTRGPDFAALALPPPTTPVAPQSTSRAFATLEPGRWVPMDVLVALGKRVAAGTISEDDARREVRRQSTTRRPPVIVGQHEAVEDKALDAEIDAALALTRRDVR